MPELPEVETTLRGIQPHIENQRIKQVSVRHYALRWPVPENIHLLLKGQTVQQLERRGKYILLKTQKGTVILHLGMSGSLRILLQPALSAGKHDHIDIEFANKKLLRFTDPRRFGAFLWTEDNPDLHPLLKHLGPEPLSKHFSGAYLWQRARYRKTTIKTLIMDSKIVTGVGNIYAAEALFAAQIHPETLACRITEEHLIALVTAIKTILKAAIKKGGTTLKDFMKSDGKPGYFAFHLKVYGRAGLPCINCKTVLIDIRLGQRSTVYCPHCQRN